MNKMFMKFSYGHNYSIFYIDEDGEHRVYTTFEMGHEFVSWNSIIKAWNAFRKVGNTSVAGEWSVLTEEEAFLEMV